MILAATIPFADLSLKHAEYIELGLESSFCVAEGAIRSGKTLDHCIIAAGYLEQCKDKYHLASGSTIGNAKLNIGVCNGFGLEALFRGRCHWGKHRDNEALFIDTQTGEKIVIFAGGGKADSYRRILGNSYGLWIATEINEHYDSDDSRISFIKVAMGRQAAAIRPMTLWDLNPCNPNHPIYDNYIDRYRKEDLPGYQYQHFTLDDNLSISDQRKAEIKAKYDVNSVWYRRDILGQRCVAEGLIYQTFADNPARFFIDKKDFAQDPKSKRALFRYLQIGVDFGGSGSAHALNAIGIAWDWRLVSLRSKRIDAKGTDVDQLIKDILLFTDGIAAQYGMIDGIYCDSAEQTIINTLSRRAKYKVFDSEKGTINDRIRATLLLMETGRFGVIAEDCKSLIDALSTARWDETKQEDVRLDDGSTDIDTLDSFEYSWSHWINQLVE